MKSEDLRLKGDIKRELLFLIYLEDKYGTDELSTSALRRIVGYKGSGGIYSAISSLKNAGFVEEKNGSLAPTAKGVKYVKENFLQVFDVIGIFGFIFIFVGLLFLFQWSMKVVFQIDVVFTSPIPAVVFLALGLLLRYGFLRLSYWIKRKT